MLRSSDRHASTGGRRRYAGRRLQRARGPHTKHVGNLWLVLIKRRAANGILRFQVACRRNPGNLNACGPACGEDCLPLAQVQRSVIARNNIELVAQAVAARAT